MELPWFCLMDNRLKGLEDGEKERPSSQRRTAHRHTRTRARAHTSADTCRQAGEASSVLNFIPSSLFLFVVRPPENDGVDVLHAGVGLMETVYSVDVSVGPAGSHHLCGPVQHRQGPEDSQASPSSPGRVPLGWYQGKNPQRSGSISDPRTSSSSLCLQVKGQGCGFCFSLLTGRFLSCRSQLTF